LYKNFTIYEPLKNCPPYRKKNEKNLVIYAFWQNKNEKKFLANKRNNVLEKFNIIFVQNT